MQINGIESSGFNKQFAGKQSRQATGKPDGLKTDNQRFPDTRDFRHAGIAMPGAGPVILRKIDGLTKMHQRHLAAGC